MTQKILSLQHPKVKHFTKLLNDRKYRKETSKVLLVGEKMIAEYPHAIDCIIATEETHFKAKEHIITTPEILEKISGLCNFSGIIAEVLIPKPQELSNAKFLLIIDKIQDPGNLGTILRTALGLGWDGVIATTGSCDFFNEKVLRACQGAIFKLPYCIMDENDIQKMLKAKGFYVVTADAQGKALETLKPTAPIALILSNEGQGLSAWAKDFGQLAAIALHNRIESLNVAVAGAIFLYELKKDMFS